MTQTAGHAGTNLLTFLTAQGFEPFADGDAVRLRNCPFHLLAQQHTELICSMNQALLGAAAAAIEAGVHADLDPAPDGCCVTFNQ